MRAERTLYALAAIEVAFAVIYVGQKVYFHELHWWNLILPAVTLYFVWRLLRVARNIQRRRELW